MKLDVSDFKKGMFVKILGGNDLWKVMEDGIEDNIILVNFWGVVISCDYARLRSYSSLEPDSK